MIYKGFKSLIWNTIAEVWITYKLTLALIWSKSFTFTIYLNAILR